MKYIKTFEAHSGGTKECLYCGEDFVVMKKGQDFCCGKCEGEYENHSIEKPTPAQVKKHGRHPYYEEDDDKW